jgi:hypothetical protein
MRTFIPFLCVAVLCLAGCKTVIPYQPNPANAPADMDGVKEVVKETISAHPNSASELEVTDKYVKMVTVHRGSFWYGAGGGARAVTIYYKNIGSHRIFQRNQWYYVELMDKANVKMCHIVTTSAEQAKKFLDALYALREKALAEA